MLEATLFLFLLPGRLVAGLANLLGLQGMWMLGLQILSLSLLGRLASRIINSRGQGLGDSDMSETITLRTTLVDLSEN